MPQTRPLIRALPVPFVLFAGLLLAACDAPAPEPADRVYIALSRREDRR
jgi:hypothetical protein